jgi:hypothetical protein
VTVFALLERTGGLDALGEAAGSDETGSFDGAD